MHNFALFFMLALTASVAVVLSEPVFAEEMASGMAMTSHTDSPLKQMSMGIDPHQVQCSAGHKLVFKASNWHPACVKESSFQTLSSWGWIANHDPSHGELTKMMEDHMAKNPTKTDQGKAQMKENVDVTADSSGTSSKSADHPKTQSHKINLSEKMDMGAH